MDDAELVRLFSEFRGFTSKVYGGTVLMTLYNVELWCSHTLKGLVEWKEERERHKNRLAMAQRLGITNT